MQYPGRTIKAGETDAGIVIELKKRLNAALGVDGNPDLRLDPNDPSFGPRMKQAVKIFQTRNVDREGRPLKQDGEVGLLTWESLFGTASVPAAGSPDNAYLGAVLALAGREADGNVREVPRNSNRGPEVDQYLRRAGVSPGLSWC
jgi:peptidoglycan hydrolase-like protein with peptidoglycan-binding domain